MVHLSKKKKENLSQNDSVGAVFTRIHFPAYFGAPPRRQIDLTEGGIL